MWRSANAILPLTCNKKVRVVRKDAVPHPALVARERFDERKVAHVPQLDRLIGRRRCELGAVRANSDFENVFVVRLQTPQRLKRHAFVAQRASHRIRRWIVLVSHVRAKKHTHTNTHDTSMRALRTSRQIKQTPLLLTAVSRVASFDTESERMPTSPAGTNSRLPSHAVRRRKQIESEAQTRRKNERNVCTDEAIECVKSTSTV